MKPIKLILLAATVAIGLGHAAASASTPMDSVFTYQGQLKENGSPPSADFDFRFTLWDAAVNGSQIDVDNPPVRTITVTDGLFTTPIDFDDPAAWNGEQRWLQIEVSPAGANNYSTLDPRQEVTAAPVSHYSLAPWTTEANGIAYMDGDVGIGTASPLERLHVDGNIRLDGAGVNRVTIYDGTGDPTVVLAGGDAGNNPDLRLFKNGTLAFEFDSTANDLGLISKWYNVTDGVVRFRAGTGNDGAGVMAARDHNGTEILRIDADSDNDANNNRAQGLFSVRSAGTAQPGGRINVQNNDGDNAITLVGGPSSSGGTMVFKNNAGTPVDTIVIRGDDANGGSMQLRNASGLRTLLLDGNSNNAGLVVVESSDGDATVRIDGDGANGGGVIRLGNRTGETTIQFIGDNGDGDVSGIIRVKDRRANANVNKIVLDAVDANGSGADLIMRDDFGNTTIVLDSQFVTEFAEDPSFDMFEQDGSRMLRVINNVLRIYDNDGTATIVLNGNGVKNAVVKTDNYGQRLLNCVESAGVWFEDLGSGQLVNGHARVDLDPVFLETITVNEQHPLKVFVTLTGDGNGVFVEKGADHFIVRELGGGKSNAGFDYRVMAKRVGFEDTRLATYVEEPEVESDAFLTPVAAEREPTVDGSETSQQDPAVGQDG